MVTTETPVRDYKIILQDSGDPGYVNRLLVGTASTGLVRMEWVQGRYGQIIPTNWSMVQMVQFMNGYVPLRYQVDDAQNMIVRAAVEGDFEWLLLVEHDNILPPDAFIRFNQYMRDEKTPVVSGLYYTRSRPSEPLIFRGRGTSVHTDWEMGDMVWCDGVPTGCLLIHCAILREMWADSEEYQIGDVTVRRVFDTPRHLFFDPESDQYNVTTGTSDLAWCTRVIEGGYFEKTGWTEYQDKKWPFVVDTNIFCRHIDMDGTQYP
jgi:hypothetical protein